MRLQLSFGVRPHQGVWMGRGSYRRLAAAAILTVCSCARWNAAEPSEAVCMPAPDRGTASLGAPVRQLAGGYRLQVVSEGPEHTGRAVRGVLWLWPTSSRDSSVRT